ncbi:hypothetical protein GQX73_g10270 [Xylaria multiplex]|uniref:Uncharacterized protein n=1 Tax=Xylaria multiplex TaxID=323545 RepID=A0A7C8MK43_9PEZI|nr:hypothetical protein GQX73_g10270 [Xylaria multiplex]
MYHLPNNPDRVNTMAPFVNDFTTAMDPRPGYAIHGQACGMMPQVPYQFEQAIPQCAHSHSNLLNSHRNHTGCLGSCSLDSGLDLRFTQRTILSRLDNLEQGLPGTEGTYARITQMGREMEDLKEELKVVAAAISELRYTMGECKDKISESGEKLEMVRVGLNDFATDMSTLVQSVDSGRGSENSSTGASPGGEADKVPAELLNYFENKGPTRLSLSSPSSVSPHSSSPSSPPLQPKPLLHGRIQQLEDENALLRQEINALQTTILATKRQHAHELATRTSQLQKQNHQYHHQLGRQAELITNVVNTIYSVFADYKEEVQLMTKSDDEQQRGTAPATDEIRVYNGIRSDSWL